MSILKFFSRARVDGEHDGRYPGVKLPHPSGSLARHIPSRAITSANKQVNDVLTSRSMGAKRGTYMLISAQKKAEIGRKAAEYGVTATVRFYASKLPDPLKESSVRDWKNAFLKEKKRLRSEGKEDTEIDELPLKKRGRPYLLGEETEMQVRAYLKTIRTHGAVLNTAIAIGCAEGIVRSKDKSQLASNGGHITFTKSWGKHILERMGFVKRRASTKAKVSAENFAAIKEQFLLDVKTVVEMEEIPHDLIINWDQTGIHYIPVSSWTMEKEGAKRVEIAGVDDKRQITGVFGASLTGDFLPVQLIYTGKTQRCLPSIKFPCDWHITFSCNHWANERTMLDYVDKILVPYISKKRKELKLPPNYPALVIFDQFKGQMTDPVLKKLDESHLHRVFVPANCTDRLQPLDVSVNKAAKEFMRGKFQDWYAKKICEKLADDLPVVPVDLKLSIVKPIGAKWLMELYDYLISKPEIMINGFRGAGIVACLSD